MKYFGIADAHGIESFIKGDPTEEEHNQTAVMLHFRAMANRHRHAVVFVVDVPEHTAEEIEGDMFNDRPLDALVHLKLSVKTLELSNLPGAEKSWNLIPNPDLDPYH